MRRLIVALGLGSIASLAMMVLGWSQPGHWLQQLVRPDPAHTGYDVFIHDTYLVLDPAPLLINVVIPGVIIYVLLSVATRLFRRDQRGAGA